MVLFLFYLALVWVLAGCLAENGLDNRVYRHPTIRLLMEGWNPIAVSTPEALQATGLVNVNELRVWHTLFITRALEVFCGSFGLFLKASFNVALPILFLLHRWHWLLCGGSRGKRECLDLQDSPCCQYWQA